MALHLGIDPGASGGVALVCSDGRFRGGALLPYITAGNREVLDLEELTRWLDAVSSPTPLRRIMVEQVASMPKQGVASTFTFGRHVGAVEAWACSRDVPVSWCTPAKWKKVMAAPSGPGKARKVVDMARLTFGSHELWKLAKHDGIAEAALLALYGVRHVT